MSDYSTLSTLLAEDIECFVFDSIPSTSDYLAGLPISAHTQLCVTNEQTRGRGQYNRTWHSVKGSSVLLSIRRQFPVNMALNGLSLVVGLAVVKVLKNFGVNGLQLKWPNDIYFKQKKLAGVLLENSVQGQRQSVIIGLGINHHMGNDFICETPWIDTTKILGHELNKVDLVQHLVEQILVFLDVFMATGFAGFANQWQAVDYLQGKRVMLGDVEATCMGVNQQGFLQVGTKTGTKVVYSSRAFSLV